MNMEYISVNGLIQHRKALEALMSESPAMRRHFQIVIRKAILAARRRITQDAHGAIESDPREAYRAVRSTVYKQILGGQVNILSPRKRGAPTSYRKPRKLDENPHQRGGNRRKRSDRTEQLESYQGRDRSFVLRFLSSGTAERMTRYGNRGSLRARHWFGTSSAYQMQAAAEEVAQMIEDLIGEEFEKQ